MENIYFCPYTTVCFFFHLSHRLSFFPLLFNCFFSLLLSMFDHTDFSSDDMSASFSSFSSPDATPLSGSINPSVSGHFNQSFNFGGENTYNQVLVNPIHSNLLSFPILSESFFLYIAKYRPRLEYAVSFPDRRTHV